MFGNEQEKDGDTAARHDLRDVLCQSRQTLLLYTSPFSSKANTSTPYPFNDQSDIEPLAAPYSRFTISQRRKNRYSSIQDAVDAANDGDVIKVATGVYTGGQGRTAPAGYDGPSVITQVVYISKTVTVRGGYTTAFTDPPDPEANPTTLDAQGQGRVLFIGGNVSPTIEGLRITGGDAAGLGGDPYGDAGGGMYVVTASNSVSRLTATTTITITDVPVAGLAAANDSLTELGDVTTLTATITAGSNVSYTWAFGDGQIGSGAVVTHTYPDLNVYTAIVTASNSVGRVTAPTTVTITTAESYIYLPLVLRNS